MSVKDEWGIVYCDWTLINWFLAPVALFAAIFWCLGVRLHKIEIKLILRALNASDLKNPSRIFIKSDDFLYNSYAFF